MSELIKVFGKPTMKTEGFVKAGKEKIYGPDGEELTEKDIQNRIAEHKKLKKYPRQVVMENREEVGNDEVTLKLTNNK